MSVLTAVVDDRIWSLERPVWFGGVRLRARTTVVRLDDGGLLLHIIWGRPRRRRVFPRRRWWDRRPRSAGTRL